MFRKRVATLVAVALLASGCGSGSGDLSMTTIGVLSAALADTAEASTYRMAMYSGTKIKLPAVGFDSTTEIDEQNPLLVGEVTRERQHFTLDLGSFLESLDEDIDDIGDIEVEIWIDDERMVMDTTGYQQLADAAPEVNLGPIAPGVFSIDLVATGADGFQLLPPLVGSPTQDLSELALSLPSALKEIEQTSSNPQIFVGTTTYADLLAAQGTEIADVARSGAAGSALYETMSVDSLTDFYIDLYENLEAVVVIELDESGLLRVFSTRVDMSDFFSKMLESDYLHSGITEQERREAGDSFKDAELVLEFRFVYEADIDLEVPPPPITTEDRTDEWREFLINAGFGG